MTCDKNMYGSRNSLIEIWHMFFLSYNMSVDHIIRGYET